MDCRSNLSDSLETLKRTDFVNFFRWVENLCSAEVSCLQFMRLCKFCQREYSKRESTNEEEEEEEGRARRKGEGKYKRQKWRMIKGKRRRKIGGGREGVGVILLLCIDVVFLHVLYHCT